jgi:hypothetical protein
MVLFNLFRRRRSDAAQERLRLAGIYRRMGKDYVTASSRTSDGFWLEEGPVDVVNVGDDAALASAVRSALSRSTHGIRAPKDWSRHVNRVVEAAGLKRFSAFAKGTAHVDVEEDGGRLRIKPFRNGGSREGYVSLEDQALDIPSDAADLAEAIETAFARCC